MARLIFNVENKDKQLRRRVHDKNIATIETSRNDDEKKMAERNYAIEDKLTIKKSNLSTAEAGITALGKNDDGHISRVSSLATLSGVDCTNKLNGSSQVDGGFLAKRKCVKNNESDDRAADSIEIANPSSKPKVAELVWKFGSMKMGRPERDGGSRRSLPTSLQSINDNGEKLGSALNLSHVKKTIQLFEEEDSIGPTTSVTQVNGSDADDGGSHIPHTSQWTQEKDADASKLLTSRDIGLESQNHQNKATEICSTSSSHAFTENRRLVSTEKSLKAEAVEQNVTQSTNQPGNQSAITYSAYNFRMLKNQPLSLARDNQPLKKVPMKKPFENTERNTAIAFSKNNSFLHARNNLRNCSSFDRLSFASSNTSNSSSTKISSSSSSSVSLSSSSSSSLLKITRQLILNHDPSETETIRDRSSYDAKDSAKRNTCSSSTNDYEDDIRYGYSKIDELFPNENTYTSNVYDSILYINEQNMVDNDADAQNYEVIHFENHNLLAKPSDSDSSLEKNNSLYEMRTNSSVSLSNHVICGSVSSSFTHADDHRAENDCANTRTCISEDDKDTISRISDGWIDESDEDDEKETRNYKKRTRLGGLRRRSKKKCQIPQISKISICSGSTIYVSNNSHSHSPSQSQNRIIDRSQQELRQSEELCRNFVTVFRSILYALPNYEAQEVTTLFADNTEDHADQAGRPEATHYGEILSEEFCDDFDDSSSEGSVNSRVQLDQEFSPQIQATQNIYGLVKKARKTVRKSWSSLNQLRKNSINNIVVNFPNKNDEWLNGRRDSTCAFPAAGIKNSQSVTKGGSVRWTSFKSKLRPKYSTVSANSTSTSVFYLNPRDFRFAKTNESECDIQKLANKRRSRTTCLESSLARPSSPPPPPPPPNVDKFKRTESTAGDDNNKTTNSVTSIYDVRSDDSTTQSHNRSSFLSLHSSNNSELDSVSHSNLQLRFADEPLYQFYAESIVQQNVSDSDGYEEIGSTTSRPSAMELITPSPNGHGQCRSLWCEVAEVKNSGILDTLSVSQQKLQEAKFEVITSEASYYKSLSVLDKIFVCNPQLREEALICKNDWKILFGNVSAVRKCSEILLAALEKCWQENIMLTGLSDVIYEQASTNFKVYVKYCSNQVYIDRTLRKLRGENVNFVELINKLEADSTCQSLSLHSFLMLPMQRITRMPLLVDAILSKVDPTTNESDHKMLKITLATLNKIVKECNENARKFERYEEMLLLSRQLEFSRKDVKMFSVASSSRWLIRSGSMIHICLQDAKSTFTRKLTKPSHKLYFFLFNDVLVIAKKRRYSEESFMVVDYCHRNVLQMSAVEDASSFFPHGANLSYKYLILLTILENHEGKTIEMILSCDCDSTRQRWLEATHYSTSDNPEEKLYEEWDCPQVLTKHAYSPKEPDELSLQVGDVVKVMKKTTDGWYHGERIRDGITGWFPGNYTVEIASQHTRAKNLKLRHRLLTLSASYLQNQQKILP